MAIALSKQFASHRGILLLVCTCLFIYWLSHFVPAINTLEWQMQDRFIKQRALQRNASKDILIIDIDDRSLKALGPVLGKWPWPRSAHAEVLEYIQAQSPKAFVFDILFTEPDIYRPDSDAYFAEVLNMHANNFLAIATQETAQRGQAPLLINYDASVGLVSHPNSQPAGRALLLLPKLSKTETTNYQLGSIDLIADYDGITRRYYVEQNIQGWGLPSLPARVAQYLQSPMPKQEHITLDWLKGGITPHQKLSYAEVLSQARGEQQTVPAGFFKDKIIILGTTSLGLHDLRATPIDDFFPGVFILSTAIDNLLSGDSLAITPSHYVAIPSVLLVLSLGLCFAMGWAQVAIGLSLVLLLGSVILSWLSALNGTLIFVLPSIIALSFLLLGSMLLMYQQHSAKLKKTIQLFSRFMDPAIVHQLIEKQRPEELLSTKSVEVTMLFSDIRNFTSISEQRTAGEMVSLLNHYFDRQVQTLFKNKATLDKFIGDAVMAFWGAPLEHREHPILAINAALEMVDNLDEFIEEYGYQDFDIGIGIHTGNAVVGLVGSHERYDYTAIGDTVNVASRIEGLTKGRSRILVSEATKKIAEDHFDFIPQGEFQVKGRSQSVKLYEPTRKMEVHYE